MDKWGIELPISFVLINDKDFEATMLVYLPVINPLKLTFYFYLRKASYVITI